jgi:MscS family membrane protein
MSRKNFPIRASSLAVIFVLFAWLASAQQPAAPATPKPQSPVDPYNRTTPQSSVSTFLDLWHARNYERASRYLNLRNLPAVQRLADGPRLAEQLGTILERDAQFDVANLSHDPEGNQQDGRAADRERVSAYTVQGKSLELQLERLKLQSGVPIWIFSQESIGNIPRLIQATSTSPLERHLPPPLVNLKFLDTPLWCWIAMFLLAVLSAAISRALSRLALLLAQAVWKRIIPRPLPVSIAGLVGPVQLLVAVAVFRAGDVWLDPSALVRSYLGHALALLTFIGLVWLCVRVVDIVVQRLRPALEASHRTFSRSVVPLGARILKLTALILGVTAILSDWGYNTTAILTGLGIGGVAIALAAQKTIENLFGGVAVISDRPVFVGDFCKFGDRNGTVEEIGVRSTRLRTADRTLVTVPNAEFSSMILENYSMRDKMLFQLTLNLRQDTAPDQVRALLESLHAILVEHPHV